jgi:hypothetical protein
LNQITRSEIRGPAEEQERLEANAPWQARAVISMTKLTEAPPMADTPANPARNVTFRPARSASRPR